MDASGSGSGSGSGSTKRKYDACVNILEEIRKMKLIINKMQTMIRENEEAHELDKTFLQKQAERDLLERMKKPDFNIDEEIRTVDFELAIADVEKHAFKRTNFQCDKLGYGPPDEMSTNDK